MGASGLGTLLVKEGFLTEQDRLTITKTCGQGSWAFAKSILSTGLLDENELAAFFAVRTKYSVAPKDFLERLDPRVNDQVDRRMLCRLEILPLEIDHQAITVAVADPLDRSTLKQLEFFTGLSVNPVIAPLSQIYEGLSRLNPSFKPNYTALSYFLKNHAGTAWVKQKITEGHDLVEPKHKERSLRQSISSEFDESGVEEISLDEVDFEEEYTQVLQAPSPSRNSSSNSDQLSDLEPARSSAYRQTNSRVNVEKSNSSKPIISKAESSAKQKNSTPFDEGGSDEDDPFASLQQETDTIVSGKKESLKNKSPVEIDSDTAIGDDTNGFGDRESEDFASIRRAGKSEQAISIPQDSDPWGATLEDESRLTASSSDSLLDEFAIVDSDKFVDDAPSFDSQDSLQDENSELESRGHQPQFEEEEDTSIMLRQAVHGGRRSSENRPTKTKNRISEEVDPSFNEISPRAKHEPIFDPQVRTNSAQKEPFYDENDLYEDSNQNNISSTDSSKPRANGEGRSQEAATKANEALIRMSLCFDKNSALNVAREFLPQISPNGCLLESGNSLETLLNWRSGRALKLAIEPAPLIQQLFGTAKAGHWSKLPSKLQIELFGDHGDMSAYKIERRDGSAILLIGDYPNNEESLRETVSNMTRQLAAK